MCPTRGPAPDIFLDGTIGGRLVGILLLGLEIIGLLLGIIGFVLVGKELRVGVSVVTELGYGVVGVEGAFFELVFFFLDFLFFDFEFLVFVPTVVPVLEFGPR